MFHIKEQMFTVGFPTINNNRTLLYCYEYAYLSTSDPLNL